MGDLMGKDPSSDVLLNPDDYCADLEADLEYGLKGLLFAEIKDGSLNLDRSLFTEGFSLKLNAVVRYLFDAKQESVRGTYDAERNTSDLLIRAAKETSHLASYIIMPSNLNRFEAQHLALLYQSFLAKHIAARMNIGFQLDPYKHTGQFIIYFINQSQII